MAPLTDTDTIGLPDKFTGTIVMAKFDVIEAYNPDTLLMVWTLRNHSNDTMVQTKYSLGPKSGYVTRDGGKTAVSDKAKNPIKGTIYSRLCLWCYYDLGMASILDGRFADVKKGGLGFMEAKGWFQPPSLTFYFEQVAPSQIGLSFKRLSEKADQDRLWPMRYVPSITQSNEGESIPKADVVKALHVIAEKHTDFDKFIAEALNVPGLSQHEDLYNSVINPSDFFAHANDTVPF